MEVMKALFLAFSLFLTISSYANLQVFPTKVMISSRQKTGTVTVRNKTKDKMTYKVSAVFYEQDYMGRMSPIDDPGVEKFSIIENLRYSPKRITLEPGQEQIVRFMVRKSNQLPNGDYRAHIRFEPIKKMVPNLVEKSSGMQMQIDARIAVNIPIIFSKGNDDRNLKLTDFNLKKENEKLSYNFKIKKEGNYFPFGTVKLFKIEENKEDKQIAFVHGVSSYVSERQFTFPIEDVSDLSNGTYAIRFFENEHTKEYKAETKVQWKSGN